MGTIIYVLICFLLFPLQLNNCEEGKYISILEAPYIAIIFDKYSDPENIVCVGLIIDNNWILTGGQCFKNNKDSYIVAYGMSDINEYKKDKVNTSTIKSINFLPGYYADKQLNDLALILLNTSIEESENVKIIKFEDSEWPQDNRKMNRKCITIGFGHNLENKLAISEVTAMHGESACECYQYRTRICLNRRDGYSLCRGDSGGPLICDGKLVGVAKTAIHIDTCDGLIKEPVCNSVDSLSMFTFTCPFLNWIHDYVGRVPKKPNSCLGIRNKSNKIIIINLSIINIFFYPLFRPLL